MAANLTHPLGLRKTLSSVGWQVRAAGALPFESKVIIILTTTEEPGLCGLAVFLPHFLLLPSSHFSFSLRFKQVILPSMHHTAQDPQLQAQMPDPTHESPNPGTSAEGGVQQAQPWPLTINLKPTPRFSYDCSTGRLSKCQGPWQCFSIKKDIRNRIFANHIYLLYMLYDKGLISRTYKETLPLNNNKKNPI